jgi:protocatechuate 3,4-dioxygenase beta subunit
MNRKLTVKKSLFFLASLSLGILPLHLINEKPAIAGCGFGDITCNPSEWTCPPGGCNLSVPGNGGTAPSKIPTQVDTRPTNGMFIRNILSGKCIDVAGAPGSANGAKLQLWDCETSGRNRDNGSPTDQQWALTSDGFIRNALSGKCIDVAGAPGNANGAKLQLWDCETSGRNLDNGSPTDQRWRLE